MTPKPELPPPLETEDDAVKWAEQMVMDCERARMACDVPIAAIANHAARDLRRRERVFLMKHGAALGALGALLRCRKISTVAYNTLVERARVTLLPTVTGGIHG